MLRIGETSELDNFDEIRELYVKGLNSEKDQLPGHLQYKSTEKDELDLHMSMWKIFNGCVLPVKQSESKFSNMKDFNRINLILEHRKSQGALMTKAKSISLLDRDFIREVKVESYFIKYLLI